MPDVDEKKNHYFCPSCSEWHIKSPEQRALEWLLTGNIGSSSKTLCAYMLGIEINWQSVPADAADRERCIKLLKLIPEWIPRLGELAGAEPGAWEHTSASTSDVLTWKHQIPLIIQEGEL